jgi:hypothetical protein
MNTWIIEDCIVVIRIMFDMYFDIMSDIRIYDVLELFRCYIGVFIFEDVISFLK